MPFENGKKIPFEHPPAMFIYIPCVKSKIQTLPEGIQMAKYFSLTFAKGFFFVISIFAIIKEIIYGSSVDVAAAEPLQSFKLAKS